MKIRMICRHAFVVGLLWGLLVFSSKVSAQRVPETHPDFTKGDSIPSVMTHDWNLGPSGARGWMFSEKMVTSVARQIKITQVAEHSPADGILAVGDVMLGVGGQPFSYDPRTELGRAITAAETTAGKGRLQVTRWRDGKVEEVEIRLPVLGEYSPMSPFNCPKSQQILERGYRVLAEKM